MHAVKKKSVGVALSGGVDSTSTAILLKEHYNVTGFFMQLAQPDIERQIARVREIAQKLAIPLHIVDLSQAFEKAVLEYFRDSYLAGYTPNPCIICNREIKFGLFLDAVLGAGMDLMATGHYAGISESDGLFHLHKGADPHKDQSYFLSRLTQRQLASLLFPLGGLRKDRVYDFIETQGFGDFRGQESQDVCFLKDSSVAQFLQTRLQAEQKPGDIRDREGKIVGRHRGICSYTIGQRRGLGLSHVSPYYVTGIDAASNTVEVGGNADLFRHNIGLHRLHWIAGAPPDLRQRYQVKIRSTHGGGEADLQEMPAGRLLVRFDEMQRAVTPGQFAVIYRGDEVVGSGEILRDAAARKE